MKAWFVEAFLHETHFLPGNALDLSAFALIILDIMMGEIYEPMAESHGIKIVNDIARPLPFFGIMRIYWFNPENDIALGLDACGGFTPARAAVEMRRAGALLPLLWAGESGRVLVVDHYEGTDERVIERAPSEGELHPWGWSRYAADMFARRGASAGQLPSEEQLELWRGLSHRATASAVLRAMGEDEARVPVVARSLEEAMGAIERFGGEAVVKLPWSCSGRGVMPVSGDTDRGAVESLVRGMIRRQGSVTVEPHLHRLRDFATLFHCQGGEVTYRGLSLFATDAAGNYSGNIVASRQVLRDMLGIDLDLTVERLKRALKECIEGYEGWVGVDMMEHRLADGTRAIAPCIEVNLRMTMGVAALFAADSPLFRSMGVDAALLHVALPGTTLPAGAHTFSSRAPQIGEPLQWPVIALNLIQEGGLVPWR